jgi:hypothetical protein
VTITASVVAIGPYQPVPSGTVDIYVGATPTTVQWGRWQGEPDDHHIPVGTTILRAVFNDTTTSTAAYRDRLQFRRYLLPHGESVRGGPLVLYPARLT